MNQGFSGDFRATGSVKRVDSHGRIVLPIDLRMKLDIKDNDPVEILEGNNCLLLRKYNPNNICIMCHEYADTVTYKGNNVCRNCLSDIVAMFTDITPEQTKK